MNLSQQSARNKTLSTSIDIKAVNQDFIISSASVRILDSTKGSEAMDESRRQPKNQGCGRSTGSDSSLEQEMKGVIQSSRLKEKPTKSQGKDG